MIVLLYLLLSVWAAEIFLVFPYLVLLYVRECRRDWAARVVDNDPPKLRVVA